MLETLAVNNEINIIWLPSHSGIYGNEIADKIAKHAAKMTLNGVEPQMPLPRTQVRTTTDKWIEVNSKLSWQATLNCAHMKCFMETTNNAITMQLLAMSKNEIRIIIGLLSGHCKLNDHLARMRIRDDPDCDLCGTQRETAKHILCECSMLAHIRERIYGKPVLQPGEILKQKLQKVVTFYNSCSEINRHISNVFY